MITVKDIDFVARGSTQVEKVPAKMGTGVRVSGGDNAVTMRLAKVLAKGPRGSAVTACSVGIRHRDAGRHVFHVSFGVAGIVIGGSGRPLHHAPRAVGKAEILCDERPAKIKPSFKGTPTYSAEIIREGKPVKSLSDQAGAITIPDFDAEHAGGEETITVEFSYGKKRANAWSMTVVHEAYTIVFTAEATQPLSSDAAELRVETRGLAEITLLDPIVTIAPAA